MGSYSRAMTASFSPCSSGRLHIATGRGGGVVVIVAVAVVVVGGGGGGGTSAGAKVGVSERFFLNEIFSCFFELFSN